MVDGRFPTVRIRTIRITGKQGLLPIGNPHLSVRSHLYLHCTPRWGWWVVLLPRPFCGPFPGPAVEGCGGTGRCAEVLQAGFEQEPF